MLSEKITQKCSSCGCKLPDDHRYNICEDCFSERRGKRHSVPRGNRGGSRSASGGTGSSSRRNGNKKRKTNEDPRDNTSRPAKKSRKTTGKTANQKTGPKPPTKSSGKPRKPKNKAAAFKKG